jgi:glycerol dehydrogenase-like iron-containing ADH family enzyme
MSRPRVAIDAEVIPDLLTFCEQAGLRRLLVVADAITYRVLGRTVEEAFKRSGLEARSVILAGEEVVADAHSILQVLLSFDRRNQSLVAVGSGTITDITRFVSAKVGVPFIVMPTALRLTDSRLSARLSSYAGSRRQLSHTPRWPFSLTSRCCPLRRTA